MTRKDPAAKSGLQQSLARGEPRSGCGAGEGLPRSESRSKSDHVIPLQGRNVCGLHVHTNLRAVTGDENIRKGNRLEI